MSNEKKLEEIDVVRREGKRIHVLGRNRKYLHHIVYDVSTEKIVKEDSVRDVHNFLLAGLMSSTGIGLSLGIPIVIYELTNPCAYRRRRKIKEYYRTVKQFENANKNDYLSDLGQRIKDIKIYQGRINDISQELGKKLERVDTGRPETFIEAKDRSWLRIRAHELGADAIVHYQPSFSGFSIGTPVKYVKGEKK